MKIFGLRLGDIIVFAICLAGLIWSYGISSFGLLNGNTDQLLLRISSHDNEWVYPLDKDIELDIEGPLGLTHIHIYSEEVWVSNSPCKNKICITAGEISKVNSWIACLPNEVFIQIESKRTEKEEVDETSF